MEGSWSGLEVRLVSGRTCERGKYEEVLIVALLELFGAGTDDDTLDRPAFCSRDARECGGREARCARARAAPRKC